jgi:hypothetical protein
MALVITVVALLSVAACSTKSNDSVSAATTTTESQDRDDATTTSRATGTTDDDDSGSGSGGSSAPLSLAECAQAGLLFSTLGLGLADEAQATELEGELDELEAKIPDQIREDFATVRSAYRAYFEALRDAGGNILDPDFQDQIQAASDELDSPEVTAAQERISDYFTNVCGR